MALIENFDVDFEDYIIFHRGIAEVSVKDDNHLHVIHQDGYDQDLGDPYGTPAREGAAAAEDAKDAALNARDAAQTAAQTANGYRIQASDSASAAQRAESEVVVAKNAAEEARRIAVEAKDEAVGICDSITASAQEIKDASDLAIAAAETVVETAEAWAVGQRNGEDVEETDPTYNNNSKYYARFAMSCQLNALVSRDEAVGASNAATQAAQQTSQDLADVQAVADDIIRPLEKLNDITYDSENDSYNINPIQNSVIDAFFAEYFIMNVEIISQPESVLYEDGVNATFSFTANFATAYRWQRSLNFGATWEDINEETDNITAEGYNTNTLTVLQDGVSYSYDYRCVAVSKDGSETYSNSVFMYKPVEIEVQLADAHADPGEEAEFYFRATGNVAYQWQSRHKDGTEWTDLERSPVSYLRPSGATKTISSVSESDYYLFFRCLAVRRDGEETTSSEARIWPSAEYSQTLRASMDLLKAQSDQIEFQLTEWRNMLSQLEEGSEQWISANNQIEELENQNAFNQQRINDIEYVIYGSSEGANEPEGGE